MLTPTTCPPATICVNALVGNWPSARTSIDVQQVFRGVFNTGEMPADGKQFDQLHVDGDRFEIGRLTVDVLHVPCHTPADVAYRIGGLGAEPGAVFVGDTLFMPKRVTSRCDFPGGNAQNLFRSFQRLLRLPPINASFLCLSRLAGARSAAALRGNGGRSPPGQHPRSRRQD